MESFLFIFELLSGHEPVLVVPFIFNDLQVRFMGSLDARRFGAPWDHEPTCSCSAGFPTGEPADWKVGGTQRFMGRFQVVSNTRRDQDPERGHLGRFRPPGRMSVGDGGGRGDCLKGHADGRPARRSLARSWQGVPFILTSAMLLGVSCATQQWSESVDLSLANLRFEAATPLETTADFTIRVQNQTPHRLLTQ